MLVLLLASAAASAAPAYVLRYDAVAETMSVRFCDPEAAQTLHFDADDDAALYVEGLKRDSGAALEKDADGWTARDWHAAECMSYHASLRRIVDSGKREGGARHGTDIVVDPAVWLLRTGAAEADVSVELPPGYAISTPWYPLPSSDDAKKHFRIRPTPNDWIARIAIGRFTEKRVDLEGGTLRLSLLDGADVAEQARLVEWITHVSHAALSAYGRLPLGDVQVLVVPVATERERDPVIFGQSTRGQGNALTLFVDATRPATDFDHDWVAVHELSHLFHPYMGGRGAWLAEGLATYYQNVLRARAGLLSPAQAWGQIDAGFARGRKDIRGGGPTLEAAGDADSPAYMRVYWSGTAYWLEVDAELRRASANRLSVDEALKRFDACCLPSYKRWEPADFVARLDAVLGTDVFTRRFREFRTRRDFPDLKALYAELGIRNEGDTLRFDDNASGAEIRRAIMAPR